MLRIGGLKCEFPDKNPHDIVGHVPQGLLLTLRFDKVSAKEYCSWDLLGG